MRVLGRVQELPERARRERTTSVRARARAVAPPDSCAGPPRQMSPDNGRRDRSALSVVECQPVAGKRCCEGRFVAWNPRRAKHPTESEGGAEWHRVTDAQASGTIQQPETREVRILPVSIAPYGVEHRAGGSPDFDSLSKRELPALLFVHRHGRRSA